MEDVGRPLVELDALALHDIVDGLEEAELDLGGGLGEQRRELDPLAVKDGAEWGGRTGPYASGHLKNL